VPERLDRKIIDLQTLARVAQTARGAGQTIAHCHGCFDIVHPGHIQYLRFARELADVLVVSLTADIGVGKGPDRPYIPQELRAENLAALEFADWVVIDPHPTAAELIELLKPQVYVKGREYAQTSDPRFLREREIVEHNGGRVVFHSGDVVFSSTRLIHNLERNDQLDECRLRTLCTRNEIDVRSTRATLSAFVGVRVIVVGDLIRERCVYCDANEMADDAPIPALQELAVSSQWGGAAAAALQFLALGARPVLVTAVAEPNAAAEPTTDLTDRGIELYALPLRRESIERKTFVADDTKLFRTSAGTCQPLDSAGERQAAAIIQAQLPQADLLVWCDHGYGMVTPGLIHAATENAVLADVTIVGCAPGSRGDIGALRNTDLLCLTERRLREALHNMGAGLPAITWELLNRTRGRRAIVALHKRGVIGFDGHSEQPEHTPRPASTTDAGPSRLRSEFVPTLAPHYVDLLGTDEAVLATSALTLRTGGSLGMATYLAAAAESLVSARAGRTAVSVDELLTWIDTRPELRAQSRFLPDAATIADIARLAPPLPAIPVESTR
jgi:rfaE bifunctional protein nucleotidyltransferase chain/domain